MDVMKPTLIYIAGRCHRKMPFEQRTEHREPLEQDNNGGKSPKLISFGMFFVEHRACVLRSGIE